MTIKLENPLLVSKIMALAKTIPDTPLDTLESMLLAGISDKDTAIYIEERNGEVRGFIFCSKEVWQGKPVAFIQFAVVKPIPEEKYIGFELLTKIKLWAKDNGLTDMVFVTKRNPKVFEKKYHFKLDGYILKREVLDVRTV